MAERKWEYGQIYEPHPELFGGRPKSGVGMTKLKKAGVDGWELVGMVPLTTSQGEVRGAFYFLKRPLP
jgi:hypothetical protein